MLEQEEGAQETFSVLYLGIINTIIRETYHNIYFTDKLLL